MSVGNKNDKKYGDAKELVSAGESSEGGRSERVNRPRARQQPAVSSIAGSNTITSVTDSLKQDKDVAERALAKAQADIREKDERNVEYEKERNELLEKLERAESDIANVGEPNIMVMPVTKQEVTFRLQRVDPTLIDVSPENERIQEFLDEISLQDIIPSMRSHGQQKPGTLRPRPEGRFELIEGSRRLASVRVIGDLDYLALVGEVPDADVRELALIENRHKDVSWYEKAKAFQRRIENGEYKNWAQLGAANGISDSHVNRYKACASLDELFVRILPSPSDMTLSYGETISKLMKKNAKSLKKKATELLVMRADALGDVDKLLETKDILQLLKSAVRIKKNKPTAKKPIEYRSHEGEVTMKHGVTNKGAEKFELTGLTSEQREKVIEYLTGSLKLSEAVKG